MGRAPALARLGWGRTVPNPMVGCDIVRDGKVLGEGYHRFAGNLHAEAEALQACKESPRGATAYVTLEPCSTAGRQPPCTRALIRAGIRRVVYGSQDPNPAHAGRGLEILRQAGMEVSGPFLREACEELNYPFFKWITGGKPFVVLKMAMTLDGRIATSSGDSRWVTGEAARQDVQKLRQMAGAVMVGAETARLDSPRLTVRNVPDRETRQPKRFIAGHFEKEGFTSVLLPDARAWDAFLRRLGKDGCLMLLIEGGGELAGRALQSGVVDEVVFYIAPKLLCGRGSRPVTGGENPEYLREALELDALRTVKIGGDLRVSGYVRGGWADVYRNR